MKNLLFFVPFLIFTSSIIGQDTLSTPCLIPIEITLDSLVTLSVERFAPGESVKKRNEKIGKYTLEKLVRFKKAINEEPLDSLFQFSRNYLVGCLGEGIFCRRVRIRPQGFSYWRGEVKFLFHFYFKDDFKENKTSSKIRFDFKKQKNGEYEFTPPKNILPCVEDPSLCEFDFLSLLDAVGIFQAKGLLDIADPYDIGRNTDEYEIVVRTPGGEGFERHIKLDMRDGKVWEDTVDISKQRYPARATIAQAKKASLVVEAERIKKTKGYIAKKNIHTSHIFKINKVFKGDIDRDTFEVPQLGGSLNGSFLSVSHQLSIPSKGIYFLGDLENPEAYNSEDSIYNYPKKYNSGLPLNYGYIGGEVPPFWATNIEGFLYKKLEEHTGQPYRDISSITVTDTAISNWIKEIAPANKELINEEGLLLGVWRAELLAENNRLEVFIAGSAASGFSYPTKMRFVVSYNPAAFGDSLAVRGLVEINRNISRSGLDGGRKPIAFFSKDYAYKVNDLESGVLEFVFEKTDKTAPPVQLLPKSDRRRIHFNELLFSFTLPIKSDSAKVGIQLLNEPLDSNSYHLDYSTGQHIPYAFTHTEGTLNYPVLDKVMPVISGLKTDSVKAGSDTVIDVNGRNFLGERTVVALQCEQQVNGTTCTRYCRIPKEYYTYRSSGHVKFKVPEIMTHSNWLNKMQPVNGGIYVINLVGEEEKLRKSKKILKILP